MSGVSSSTTCPKCYNEMETYNDWKPYDSCAGCCLYCGFEYYTQPDQLTLEDVNDMRAEREMRPLKRLRKQKKRYKLIN